MRTKCCRIFLIPLLLYMQLSFSHGYCPPHCMCSLSNVEGNSTVANVRCVGLPMHQVPSNIPQNTTILDLRFNRLRTINPPNVFKPLKNLQTLLINNNQISRLDNGTFDSLENLKYLYLYKNKIREIESGVFHNLPSLEQLYLHFNQLESIPRELFSHLPRLERLFLHNNKISKITPSAFGDLKNLKRLRLDGNALICDCKMLWLVKKLHQVKMHGRINSASVICAHPEPMVGHDLAAMSPEDLHCRHPSIIEQPQDIELRDIFSTIYFTCRVDGDPMPDVLWMRNSSDIIGDEHMTVKEDGTLMISSVKETDVGVYECIARSPAGEARSRPARMVYTKKDLESFRFIKKPENLTSQLLATVSFQCVTEPSSAVILWYKSDLLLTTNSKYTITQDNSLYVQDVGINDQGLYRCEASKNHQKIYADAILSVDGRPRFLVRPVDVTVADGSTADFDCIVNNNNTTIRWLHNGNVLLPDERKILLGNKLRIDDVQEEDSGPYTCIAENDYGRIEAVAELRTFASNANQFIGDAPVLVHTPVDISAPVGVSVELPCRARGNPIPIVIWRKDGQIVSTTERKRHAHSGSLYLAQLDKSDAGVYTCSAVNDFGKAEATATLLVSSVSPLSDWEVVRAAELAAEDVDEAVRRTLHGLGLHEEKSSERGRMRVSPHELLRLVRFPNAAARQLARAADVYERTLHLLRKHQRHGLTVMNLTNQEYRYKDLLSPSQLALIANLSGCVEHRPIVKCDICKHKQFRSADGMCNNLGHPTWGASFTQFQRMLPAVYEDGFSLPVGWTDGILYNGHPLPSARLISTKVISTQTITPDPYVTHMLMQWGQFLDHDLDHALPSVSSHTWGGKNCKKTCEKAAPCYPIDIPDDDPRIRNRRCMDVVRSSAICGSGQTSVLSGQIQPREQINQLTSFIDASQIYGFSQEMSNVLRNFSTPHGLLRVSNGGQNDSKLFLPFAENHPADCRRNATESDIDCFLAGDIRANEQVGLLAMHTIWLREHNRVAHKLKEINPHWDGDRLYEEARKVVGAEIQHITWQQWLPLILGPDFGLGSYKGYDPSVDPSIINAFATAALRFGHSLINPVLERLDSNYQPIPEGHLPLMHAFFAPWRLVKEGGVDPLMRGLVSAAAKLKMPGQPPLNHHLTEHLFEVAHAVALDLAAINIQRGRDHALPAYTKFRAACNLTAVSSFDELSLDITSESVREGLRQLYHHVDNIDLWVGGILEDNLPNAKLGPTFKCIMVEQFRKLRDGDRFWYENVEVFTGNQLSQIKQSSLARVVCDNADNITEIQRDVFLLPTGANHRVSCDQLPYIDLQAWKDCEHCNSKERDDDNDNDRQLNLLDNNIRRTRNAHFLKQKDFNTSSIAELTAMEKQLKAMQKKITTFHKQIKSLKRILLRKETTRN